MEPPLFVIVIQTETDRRATKRKDPERVEQLGIVVGNVKVVFTVVEQMASVKRDGLAGRAGSGFNFQVDQFMKTCTKTLN